jgi:HAD superfamily hydrolase (TIGR01484 family)
MKKVIAFDQDDTLNITKLPIDATMADLLTRLLDKYEVCVISGTGWETMKANDVDPLINATPKQLARLHIMPTTGTQYWHFVDGEWRREYANFLTDEQVTKIFTALEKAARQLGFWCDNPVGEIIENRNSQITYSALGQSAPVAAKKAWDADQKKRRAIVKLMKPELADIGVNTSIGGTTSIDVTMPGIDKAYGMRQLMKQLGVKKSEILFIGDKLQPGGNDYPVRAMGIDTIEVVSYEDTNWVIKGILGVS